MFILREEPINTTLDKVDIIEIHGRTLKIHYLVPYPKDNLEMKNRAVGLCFAFCFHYGIKLSYSSVGGKLHPMNDLYELQPNQEYPKIPKALSKRVYKIQTLPENVDLYINQLP